MVLMAVYDTIVAMPVFLFPVPSFLFDAKHQSHRSGSICSPVKLEQIPAGSLDAGENTAA